MNELLQKHGCSNVFTVPEGLKELMSDITREVLRWQPPKIFDFIANYLSALLITREHGIMAVKILDDLCDCRPTVSEHLLQIGLERTEVDILADIIKSEIEGYEPVEGKDKVKETAILKKVLTQVPLDEEMSAKVCQVARNAYRDYWYRKDLLKKGIKVAPEEAWEKAAEHTLEIYKKTRPSISELQRATEKIQAAYRGYHVRRHVLRHLEPPPKPKKKKKPGRKVEIPGPPLDIASSREISLGPVVNIRVREDDVIKMFKEEEDDKLGLGYDPMKTISHKEDDEYLEEKKTAQFHVGPEKGTKTSQFSVKEASFSHTSRTDAQKSSSDERPIEVNVIDIETEPDEEPSPYQRISFAEAPPEVIKEAIEDDDSEVPEVPEMEAKADESAAVIPPGAFEVPEELQGEDIEVSAKLSSGPPSAHTTDVEEVEEEG